MRYGWLLLCLIGEMLINPFLPNFQTLIFIGLSVLIFGFSAGVSANNGRISFENFSLKASSELNYKVNAQLRFQLTDYLRKSLREGVPLISEIQLNLVKRRIGWWDKNKNLATIISTLQYHPLSQHYQVIQKDTNDHWNFKSLNAALRKMGLLKAYRLPKLSNKIKHGNYNIVLYASIRPDTFKFPMKIHALFVNKYKIETSGVQWPLP